MLRTIAVISATALAIAGLAVWVNQASIVYSLPLSAKYRLTIRSLSNSDEGKLTLRITYHYPPAIGTFVTAEQTIVRPATQLTFSHAIDDESGLQCVYDNNDVGFLLLYHVPTDDLWDSTGRAGGWNGTEDSLWQSRLDEIRKKTPGIPYSELPNQSSEQSVAG